ncbi:glycosyltransferase family 2 protein [Aquirufa sp. ROCK2-A2]
MSKLLSIITITYQAEKFIQQTLDSIHEQHFLDEIEYIIVDGASKDDTLKIIENHPIKVDQLISEKDHGIYDAMNKGIQASSGKYLLFMNAGDTFADKSNLENIQNNLRKNPDVLYGESIFVNLEGEKIGLRSEVTPHLLPKQMKWQDFKFGMPVCHQSFIVKKEIAPLYSMEYRLSSDFDWVIKCLKRSRSSININSPISLYLIGGASVQNLKKSWMERFTISANHFGTIPTLFYHLIIIIRGIIFGIKRKGKYW